VALVVLRVVIGWHFFLEGLSHKNDPKWSSEGFLRAAKGPLGEFYHSRAPGLHEHYLTVLTPMWSKEADDALDALRQEEVAAAKNAGQGAAKAKDAADEAEKATSDPAVAKARRSPIYGPWFEKIVQDWEDTRHRIANFYGFSDEQKDKLVALVKNYDKKLVVIFEGDKENVGFADAIKGYRHELWRNQEMQGRAGAGDIPHLKTRQSKREGSPAAELPADQIASNPSEWIASVKALGDAFELEALSLRTEEQEKLGAPPMQTTSMKQADTAITWLLIIGGACLAAGLFTRLSALVLALFLASVVLSQPFWSPDAIKTTYFEWVELVALLVLATSHVGRWAGLDFFVHHVLLKPFRSA
jgi:uncharacterized membrane protein YphA (DoxX/SURF4 family)